MKKIFLLLLTFGLLLALCACSAEKNDPPEQPDDPEETASVFPDGVTICGTDVSGMTDVEAELAIREKTTQYMLALWIGEEDPVMISAEELRLSCNADFAALAEQCRADDSLRKLDGQVLTYDPSAIEDVFLKQYAGLASADAVIVFDEKAGEFRIESGSEEQKPELGAVLALADQAVLSLQPELKLAEKELGELSAMLTRGEQLRKSIEEANARLRLSLTYTYTPTGEKSSKETLSGEKIASFLMVSEDGLSVELDTDAMMAYVNEMREAHSIQGKTSVFLTTGGKEISVRVPTAGQTVDADALFEDLVKCIDKRISGAREAPYVKSDANSTSNFGGNYVEIDLDAQKVWAYNNGKQVASSSIVSGCVNEGNATPEGVYFITGKETDTYLVGPGYRSHVDYWMPFNGNIGLHDADGWRGAYGGSIYRYDGSHGCINMPRSTAKAIYDNVTLGTAVILYGGIKEVPPLTQSLRGTQSYSVLEGAEPFALDAKPTYSADLVYSSDHTDVVSVDRAGTVTVHGIGTATVTVKAKERRGYTAASMTVTVTVQGICDLDGHQWDQGSITTEASCEAPGQITYTCAKCKATKTEPIPEVGHQMGEGTVTVLPTCTTGGVKEYTCTVCGTKTTEDIPELGHSWDEAVDAVLPGCETEGATVYTCSACGETMTETVPATGHHFVDGVCESCGTPEPAPETPPESEPESNTESDPESSAE